MSAEGPLSPSDEAALGLSYRYPELVRDACTQDDRRDRMTMAINERILSLAVEEQDVALAGRNANPRWLDGVDETEVAAWFVELTLTNPFAPFDIEIRGSTRVNALSQLLSELDVPAAWTGHIRRARYRALRSQRPVRWRAVVRTGLQYAIFGWPMLLAAHLQSGERSETAPRTAQIGGLWLLDQAGRELNLTWGHVAPEEFRVEVIRLQMLHECLREQGTSQTTVSQIEEATLRLVHQAELAEALALRINDPGSEQTKAAETRRDALVRAKNAIGAKG